MEYVTIKHVVETRGISRASIYRDLAEGRYQAVKAGKRTLIDVNSLNAYFASLPKASFRAPPAKAA